MQSRSELPSESRERLETELLLQPISSCIQHFYCPHCQVSGALSLLRVALAFHTLSPIPWYFPDTSAWKPLPCSFLESTARLPSYHLSDLGHTTSAFQMQEKRGACQFAVRRAKKIRTAGFPLKTSLLSDCGLMPWGRQWGKSKNQKPIQPSLAITFQLFQPVGPFLLTFTVLGIAHKACKSDFNSSLLLWKKIPRNPEGSQQNSLGISMIWAIHPGHIIGGTHYFGCNTSKKITEHKIKTNTKEQQMHMQFPTCWAADIFPKQLKSKSSERSCQMTKERHQDPTTSTHTLQARHESLQHLLCTYCCNVQIPTQLWGLPKPSKGKTSRFMKSHIQILKKSADK